MFSAPIHHFVTNAFLVVWVAQNPSRKPEFLYAVKLQYEIYIMKTRMFSLMLFSVCLDPEHFAWKN